MITSMDEVGARNEWLRSAQLADLAGTTPRALRHYHRIGLLAEPARDANGYRRYTVDDLLRVLRIRQLVESGVSLRRAGAMLAEHPVMSHALIDEIDAHLVEQLKEIQARRDRLAELRQLTLPTTDPAPPSRLAQYDRDMWLLLTSTGQVDDDTARSIVTALAGLDPDATLSWIGDFDALADADSVDSDVRERLVEEMSVFYRAVSAEIVEPADTTESPPTELLETLHRQRLSPAQREVWRAFQTRIES